MKTVVEFIDGVKFKASARGHEVFCDQPESNGGKDEAMTPPEFLLVSLGTCAGFYAVQYLKTRSLPVEGLRVEVHAEKAADRPARVASFRIEVFVPQLEERHREGVLRAVKSCLIHNTLLNTPAIETVLHTPVEAGA